MEFKILFILLASIFAGFVVEEASGAKPVVCYYGTWATYRPGNGKFDVEHIDPKICTHIIYSFFGISDDDITYLDAWLDLEDNYGRGNIRKFINLKQQNPNVKLLAAIGGWNFGSLRFSDLARNPTHRRNFARNSMAFLRRHGFDGLDVDWEYPNQRGGRPEDVQNFPLLLRDIYEVYQQYGYLLTIAVGATPTSAKLSYDIPNVVKYVDLVHLMTYDMHGSWNPFTGIHAALYWAPDDKNPEWNVDTCVNYWLDEGTPKAKLIVGMATYGRTFRLSNQADTAVHALSAGAGEAGPYTREGGFLGYNEVCVNQWPMVWDEARKVPFAFRGNQWIGYDNVESITIKCNYVIEHNLGGSMIWSLETDDFRGTCGHGQYPLLSKIHEIMEKGSQVPVDPPTNAPTTRPPPTTPTSPRPTPPPGSEFQCWTDGTFRDPHDCAKWHVCQGDRHFTFRCPDPLLFDETTGSCNWPSQVQC